MYLHMNVPCSVDCNFQKKKQETRAGHLGVLKKIVEQLRIANPYLVFK